MKLKTIGQAFIIILAIPMLVLAEVARFAPEALTLRDPETKDPLFRISAGKGKEGFLNKNGASFPTTNSEGYPQLTLMIPADVCPEGRLAYIKDTYGFALDHISKLETQVQTAYNKVTETLGAAIAGMEVD